MTNLLINVDHVATLRNARRETFPDPVEAAARCEDAGADGIVFHLRVDRRHITDDDVARLKQTVRGKLDFELSTAPDIVDICCRTQPDTATLVPERREEVTTENGLDVVRQRASLEPIVRRLFDAGISEVSMFVDPNLDQISASADVGANCVELHTGAFATAKTEAERLDRARELARAARHALSLGLHLHAGHGLDYDNYPTFSREVHGVEEVSIGFAIVAGAIFVGMEQAVRDMLALVKADVATAAR